MVFCRLGSVSIPYKSGHLSDVTLIDEDEKEIEFQSRINPGIFQTMQKMLLQELRGKVSIPYKSGHLSDTKLSRKDRNFLMGVSIPYKSGHLSDAKSVLISFSDFESFNPV